MAASIGADGTSFARAVPAGVSIRWKAEESGRGGNCFEIVDETGGF
ncbi:MAG: hypothetical protein KF735_03325 [Chelatococcus sp.]|nr:hypothetical protein [Chelatococcus sp.]MBX3536645.1 hypothetical protein [Chelatococcus sp.]